MKRNEAFATTTTATSESPEFLEPPLRPSPVLSAASRHLPQIHTARVAFAPLPTPSRESVLPSHSQPKSHKRPTPGAPSSNPHPKISLSLLPGNGQYESMEDRELGCTETFSQGMSSSKRHKDESGSLDSLDTIETSREHSLRQKGVFGMEEEALFAGLLECSENLGVHESPVAERGDEDSKGSCAVAAEETEAVGCDTLNYLVCREQAYSPDPYYLEKCQPDITWTMRLILMDWMMEVCAEFQLKRETFHYSVNFVDRFLSAVPRVSKTELQLVGATALFAAAKMEEVCTPKVRDFAKSTDNGYTIEQIRKMELVMTKALKWELAPPTLNMWANWYMSQWDSYIQHSDYAKSHQLIRMLQDPIVVFKQPNEKSYARFRELSQLIDLVILDISTLRYSPRAVVASAMYVLLAFHFGQATIEEIATQFPKGSFFLNEQYPFNDLFSNFLHTSFGFGLPELLPTIQFVAGFLLLPFNYDVPVLHRQSPDSSDNFEEFLSYQTHHPQQLEFIRRRPR